MRLIWRVVGAAIKSYALELAFLEVGCSVAGAVSNDGLLYAAPFQVEGDLNAKAKYAAPPRHKNAAA